jgi:tetratricopeptide (TPR) repeat protein
MYAEQAGGELLAEAGAALLEGSEPSRAKAVAFVNLSGSLMQAGRNQEAIRVGRQALALAELTGDRGLQARAHGSIGGARSFIGDAGGIEDLERGFELQARGREAAERFGLANELRILAAERVLEDYWRGRWEAALAGADRFIAETAAGVRHFMEDVCRLVRGRIRLARGDLAGALTDAAADVELGHQQEAPEALQAALALQAHALLVAGSVGEADRTAGGDFERAAEGYARIGSLPDEAFARLRAAGRLAAAGRHAAAERQHRPALVFWRRVGAAAHLGEAPRVDSAS